MTPNVFIDKDPDHLHRFSQWSDWSVTVVGIGIAGFACADALAQLGARVTVVDAGDGERQRERAEILDVIGVTVLLGHEGAAPAGTDLLVVSPGLRPSAPIIVEALDRGIPVWGELELAWRLRHPDTAAAWLCVTGTNGKTTATLMLESMLRAAGYRTVSAGNIGHSLVDVVMHDELDVIAIEVGAPQLPFVHTMSPVASVCLNIADDHIDHFGSMEAYVAAKARVYERTQEAAHQGGLAGAEVALEPDNEARHDGLRERPPEGQRRGCASRGRNHVRDRIWDNPSWRGCRASAR